MSSGAEPHSAAGTGTGAGSGWSGRCVAPGSAPPLPAAGTTGRSHGPRRRAGCRAAPRPGSWCAPARAAAASSPSRSGEQPPGGARRRAAAGLGAAGKARGALEGALPAASVFPRPWQWVLRRPPGSSVLAAAALRPQRGAGRPPRRGGGAAAAPRSLWARSAGGLARRVAARLGLVGGALFPGGAGER